MFTRQFMIKMGKRFCFANQNYVQTQSQNNSSNWLERQTLCILNGNNKPRFRSLKCRKKHQPKTIKLTNNLFRQYSKQIVPHMPQNWPLSPRINQTTWCDGPFPALRSAAPDNTHTLVHRALCQGCCREVVTMFYVITSTVYLTPGLGGNIKQQVVKCEYESSERSCYWLA